MGPSKDKGKGKLEQKSQEKSGKDTEAISLESVKQNDATHEWQENVNEAYADLMESRGETVPPVAELLKDVDLISRSKVEASQPDTQDPDKEFDEMIDEQIRQIIEDDTETTPVAPKKPVFRDSVSSKESKALDYQESFTSQQETAELREEYTVLASRLTNLETVIEGLVAERKNLPEHLERLSSSINTQFTIMNERLNAAIESGIATESAQQLSQQVTDIASSSSNVLGAVKEELHGAPSKHSQVAQPKPITGKKKRVRLLD